MPGVGRLYTPTTVRYRLSAMARLRTIIRTVGSFLVSAGIDIRRDLVGFPKGSARAVKCLRTLFEIVDRKKEKRGRRSPCGLPSLRVKARLGGGQMTSAVLRFDLLSRAITQVIAVLGTRQTL